MLVHRVAGIIYRKRLLNPGATVIVGTSGGADSTALLHILKACNLDLHLIAVYVDHGLRPVEAEAELAFVKELAADLQADFHSRKIDVKGFRQQHGLSLEEAARTLRYRAFEDIRASHNAQAIAVAHTADDQAEEFLIRMIRGSGLKGLSGMAYSRDGIIRPLLAESKTNLLTYLAQHQIGHLHDSSNNDRSFLRNRIRLDLLPELEEHYNPAIRTNILQTTGILHQEEDLLETLAGAIFTSLCTVTPDDKGNGVPLSIALSRKEFSNAHPALQRRVLEKICWAMLSRPSFRKILQLQQMIGEGLAGARQHLPDGLRLRLEAETVMFFHPAGRQRLRGNGDEPILIEETIPGSGSYIFPEIARQLTIARISRSELEIISANTLVVDGDKVSFPLVVRSARQGEKMKPLGAPGRKKVSRIFNDLKIPADVRPRYPLLTADLGIVAILGLKIADYCKYVQESTTLLSLTWKDIDHA